MSGDILWDPKWVDTYETSAEAKTKVEIVKALVAVRRRICRDRMPVFPLSEEEFMDELKLRAGATLVWEKKLCGAYMTKWFKPEDVELRWLLGGEGPSGAGGFVFEPIKSVWRGARAMERYVHWYRDVAFQFTPEGEGTWVGRG